MRTITTALLLSLALAAFMMPSYTDATTVIGSIASIEDIDEFDEYNVEYEYRKLSSTRAPSTKAPSTKAPSTKAPSAAPSVCEEKPKTKFFFRKKKNKVIAKTCKFLSNIKKYAQKKKICEKNTSEGKFKGAADQCPVTCGICGCYDDDETPFYLNKKKTQTCDWLRGKEDKIEALCAKKPLNKKKPSASQVCIATCKKCVIYD